ncbi:MAG TPA: hypothetical protein VFX49_11780 [Chloroflexota bacterium]|nr:hypothetical protein [Chloroflexota bacterium]
MSRRDVAKRLGRHISSVRNYERDGSLPFIRRDGRVLFEPAAVDALAAKLGAPQPERRRRRTSPTMRVRGELAAKVFSLIRSGMSLPEIVIAAKLPPETVRELWREYRTPFEQGERERLERESEEVAARVVREMQREQRADRWMRHQRELAQLRAKQR